MNRPLTTLFLAAFCPSLFAGELSANLPSETTVSAAVAKKVSLHLQPDAPISEKVRILQEFLGEHYFDENGIMYALWFWKGDELRPFREEDLAGASIRFFDAPTAGSDADPIHNPPLTALNQMAYLVTGDPKYQKEALRSVGLVGDFSTYYDRARRQMRQAGTTGLSAYSGLHRSVLLVRPEQQYSARLKCCGDL